MRLEEPAGPRFHVAVQRGGRAGRDFFSFNRPSIGSSMARGPPSGYGWGVGGQAVDGASHRYVRTAGRCARLTGAAGARTTLEGSPGPVGKKVEAGDARPRVVRKFSASKSGNAYAAKTKNRCLGASDGAASRRGSAKFGRACCRPHHRKASEWTLRH